MFFFIVAFVAVHFLLIFTSLRKNLDVTASWIRKTGVTLIDKGKNIWKEFIGSCGVYR